MQGYGGYEMGALNPLQMFGRQGPGAGYATPYGFARPAPYGAQQGYGRCAMPAQQMQGVGRTLAIGFDSVAAVAAAGSAVITQRPQVRMQPSRIIIPSAIGGSFLVNDIKIGKNSQLTASSTLPAAVFAENAVGTALSMDPCDVAMDITLSVTNISGGAVRFNGAMIGVSCW
jgi:hypothetical protein